MTIGRQSEGSIIRGLVNQKWVPYSQRYSLVTLSLTLTITLTLLTLILDIGLSNLRIIEPSDYRYITNHITWSGTGRLKPANVQRLGSL